MVNNTHFFWTLANHDAKELAVEVGENTVRIGGYLIVFISIWSCTILTHTHHIMCLFRTLYSVCSCSIGSQIFQLLGMMYTYNQHSNFSYVLHFCKGGDVVKRLVLQLHCRCQSTTPKKRDRCFWWCFGPQLCLESTGARLCWCYSTNNLNLVVASTDR